ncbi:hypothetical protein B0J13DRAFT_673883 [Dactylonectria estremocensis]|uniref:Zn(2)-C6 fungal-type domain-containing protein n=1 Tax=Dactylonectria estremocensis TaxID=1079267 RepID=A0A9P9JBK8_9HYPO|nr:hypothetical protein B0J13DRAFT_673883 [Dactylonectria estremocensis]
MPKILVEMRRQNRSCDQCRKAKRACDLAPLQDKQGTPALKNPGVGNGNNVSFTKPHHGNLADNDENRHSPCSYCRRTGKQCTLNWARNRLRYNPTGRNSPTNDRNGSGRVAQHQSPHLQVARLHSSVASDMYLRHGAGLPNVSHAPMFPPCSDPRGPVETSFAIGLSIPSPSVNPMPMNTAIFDSATSTNLQPEGHQVTSPQSIPFLPTLNGRPSITDSITHVSHLQSGLSSANKENRGEKSVFRDQVSGNSPSQSSSSGSNSYKHGGFCPSVGSGCRGSDHISPFSTAHVMTMNINKKIISSNLISIYHNAFELALSCCLSQEACPYRFNAINQPATNGISWLASRFEDVSLVKQYNPEAKKTGVYYRVSKLDRVAQTSGFIRLSKTEDRAVSKALYLAIMAFAVQWAKKSQSQPNRTPSSIERSEQAGPETLSDEFDRTLQKSLWASAKRALQECVDVECFRIVCAEWIMGLAQKPMEEDDFPFEHPDISSGATATVAGRRGYLESRINEIIAADGPPWFIERAARRVHTLKFRYDCLKASLSDELKDSSRLESAITVKAISDEDMGTFSLMYWMTIMIDTISSAMNNRPVVLSDTDCHHDPAYLDRPDAKQFGIECHPHDLQWWAKFFDPTGDELTLRWPCSYDTATRVIVAATPVKVVLFRLVTRLQNAIRSNHRGESIEVIISNCMAIYQHWNANYSAFFQDMIEQYDIVPMQLRIWFIHVVVYFHCATLILADLLELVDSKGLGLEYSSQVRVNIGVVEFIRRDSSTIVSDLAKASEYPADTNVSGMSPAVVKRAILPEPWTMILIRAFTKVAMLLLNEVEEAVWHDPASRERPFIRNLVARCESCIKSLHYLGRKSDMARVISAVLFSSVRMHLVPTSVTVTDPSILVM